MQLLILLWSSRTLINLFWPHTASICNGGTSSVKKVVTKQNINIGNCHKKYCSWESITYKWRAKYNVRKTNPDVSQIKLHLSWPFFYSLLQKGIFSAGDAWYSHFQEEIVLENINGKGDLFSCKLPLLGVWIKYCHFKSYLF